MTSALKSLHTALVDARNGYQEAATEAEDGTFRTLFGEMASSRETAHAQIHSALRRLGETPDDDGSFMSSVHKTIIDIRAAVTGLGANALGAFVSGEENILAQYDRAIEESAGDRETTALLQQQKDRLLADIARMKSLQA